MRKLRFIKHFSTYFIRWSVQLHFIEPYVNNDLTDRPRNIWLVIVQFLMSLVDLISETVYKYVTKSMKICIYMLKESYLLKEH